METEQVVEGAVQTEHYLDSNDVESDGVLILTIRGAASQTLGSAEQLSPDSYVWWNWSGSLSIPDGPDGSWVATSRILQHICMYLHGYKTKGACTWRYN